MRTYSLWFVLLLLPVSACRTSRQAETAAFREQVWGDSAGGHEACSLQFSQRMEAVHQQLSGLSVRVVEYGRFDSVIAPKKITEISSVAAENKRMRRADTVRRVAEKETSLKRARKETVGETSVEKKRMPLPCVGHGYWPCCCFSHFFFAVSMENKSGGFIVHIGKNGYLCPYERYRKL